MKILHLVTRSEPGGSQGVVRSLATSQAADGSAVAIAYGAEGGGEAFAGLDARITQIPIQPLRRAIHPINEIKAFAAIVSLYRDLKPDIVHLHTSKAGALGRLATLFGRSAVDPARIVYTMHGYDQLRVENRTLLGLDKALRGRCGAVVAVSRLDAQAMEHDGYRVTMIPNGVPDPRAGASVAAPDARSAQSARPMILERFAALKAQGLPVAITVARGARPKRIDLARAIAHLTEGCLNIAWIGGDPLPDDPPNFHALGALPDAAAYFAYADLFFLASDHEGMPLAVLEALAAGLPTVASDVGGIPEILGADYPDAPPCGITVPNEAARFAEALTAIAGDPRARKEMSELGWIRWAERYSDKAMARGYRALYHSLIGAT